MNPECQLCGTKAGYGWPFSTRTFCGRHRTKGSQFGGASMINNPLLQQLCLVCKKEAAFSNTQQSEFYCIEHADPHDLDHRVPCSLCSLMYTPNYMRTGLVEDELRLVCYVCQASPALPSRSEREVAGRIAYSLLADVWLTGRKRTRDSSL